MVQMQTKHGDEVVAIVSQIMDLLEVGDTQSLANSSHEFWSMKMSRMVQWSGEQTQGFIKTTKVWLCR